MSKGFAKAIGVLMVFGGGSQLILNVYYGLQLWAQHNYALGLSVPGIIAISSVLIADVLLFVGGAYLLLGRRNDSN
jgi:hypothetical protein